MAEKKNFIQLLLEGLKRSGPGAIGAVLGLAVGLLLMIFGFWRSFFILLLAVLGYYLGVRYFSNRGDFRALLDKLFPPGLFR